MIKKYLDVSLSHLTMETVKGLTDDKSPYSFRYDEGVFVTVPEDDDREWYQKLPKDLRILLRYCWTNDIQLIRLDKNAEKIQSLPTYIWQG